MTLWTNSLVRGGARAATGIVIVAAGVSGALALATMPLPTFERAPVAMTVDTLQGAERQLVCAGSFSVLGADPARPSVAVPVGSAALSVAAEGDADQLAATALSRQEPGETPPQVFTVPAGEPFAAAATQAVATDTLRGLTASACAEPVNEQWLVGGSTSLGVATTVNLANPTGVPATVQLTVFDENGEVDQAKTTGVLVPAGSERTVSLNGYAPGREHLATRVVSTGAAVTASLSVAHVVDLSPFAVDTTSRQLAPSGILMFPGLTNISDHVQGPGDAGTLDPYPVRFRVLAPGGEAGSARIDATFADGERVALGSVEYADGAVADVPIEHWPAGATGALVTAEHPIVGAALGSADANSVHDYAWFAPSPVLAAETDHAVAVAPGGQLVLMNPGTQPAEVIIGSASAPLRVPAGAAVIAAAAESSVIVTTAPIAAGVRLANGSEIAGYPVLPLSERAGSITVYTR